MEIQSELNTELLILEVAEKLFLEKGFAATSTTQIAREVGCNQALIHYYFRTKDNLFNTIFEEKFKEFFQVVFDLEKLYDISFEEKLRHIILAHFDMLNKNRKLPALIITECNRRPSLIMDLQAKFSTVPNLILKPIQAELQTEIDAGRIRNMSIINMLISMVSLNVSLFLLMPITGEILQFNEEQKELIILQRRDEHVNIILRSLRPEI